MAEGQGLFEMLITTDERHTCTYAMCGQKCPSGRPLATMSNFLALFFMLPRCVRVVFAEVEKCH